MAFSRLIWAGADYCRNNCYPSEPGSIVTDVSPGSYWHRAARKRRINQEQTREETRITTSTARLCVQAKVIYVAKT